jgi:Asp-tRNA(Asn)/Glu-tRNA(Gln) amidotransferase A subunit family amidase
MTAIEIEPLLRHPMTTLAARYRRHELAPSEYMRATLAYVERVNPALNAIVTGRWDEALAEARRADAAFAPGCEPRPLEGVPFTVKDLLATAGLRTTAGSLLLRDHVPAWTAPVVQRLQEAGAILLGKANCSEFGIGNLHAGNRPFGDTRNPWNLSRTPGGSSGGDSAAVAAGLSVFGIGTDYGGSVRWPAHCTGVTSIRPTPGLLPTTGVLPHSGLAAYPEPPSSSLFQCWIQTIGPIARSAADLVLLVSAMKGPDGIDSHAVRSGPIEPAIVDIRRLRCAWLGANDTGPVQADVRGAIRTAVDALRRRGLMVQACEPPGFADAAPAFERIRSLDGLPDHARVAAGRYAELSTLVRESIEGASQHVDLADYRERVAAGDRVRGQVLTFMCDWPILLLPIGTIPAFEPGEAEYSMPRTIVRRSEIEASCRAISLLRVPAASVPCGTSEDGLPIGVQIVGRPFYESEVLAVAVALEQELGCWQPSPTGRQTPSQSRHGGPRS